MTDIPISPVARRVQFTGNTGTGPFAFTFNILQDADLAVYKNETLLTLTTDYTVSTNANGTGSITLTDALITTDVLTILGGRELSRTTDFVTAGDLLAASLNEQLDSLVIMAQQINEKVDRSFKIQPMDDVNASFEFPLLNDRKGKYLFFNATTGQAEVNSIQTIGAITVPIQISDGGTAATDTATARANLGTTEEAEVLALALS
jgi:hypothetical protein